MKYFTMGELCRSAVADARGIKNTCTKEQAENLKELVAKVLDPLRELYGKPIIVNSGFRSVALNKAVGGAATSQHCFDTETEILTNNGWKNHQTISTDDMVYTYSFEKSGIELKPINEIIRRHFTGDLYRIRNKHLDVVCTDKHNVIVRYDCRKYVRRNTKNITPKGQAYFDSLKTNNDQYHFEHMEEVIGKRRLFMTSGYSTERTEYDAPFMHFVLAVVADGYIGNHCGATPYVGFHAKKPRKVIELRRMMNELGIKFSMRKDKDETYSFCIGKQVAEKVIAIIGRGKNIPNYIMKADVGTLRSLIDTYTFFDGHRDMRDGNIGVSITSTNYNNISILQAMCVLSGMRCTMSYTDPPLGSIGGRQLKSAKRAYSLSFCPDATSSKFKEDSASKIQYDGEVWCIRDDNNTVIVRRNGRVSIQGNCRGEAADLTGGSREENKKLIELIKKHLPYDQLIDEKDGSWVHVSYKRIGLNRHQFLKL